MCDASARSRQARGIPAPRWRLLYGLVFVMLAALALVEIVALPGALRTTLRGGLVLGGFGGMAWWVGRNRAPLDQQDRCACAAERIIERVVPALRPEPHAGRPTVPPIPSRAGDRHSDEEDKAWAVRSAQR